jgi:hypothetical protein
VAWWAGNIGYRRPQIRLTKTLEKGPAKIQWQGALSHNVNDTQIGPVTADDARLAAQTRASVTWPVSGERTMTVGLSAHSGEDEAAMPPAGARATFGSWSVNLDLSVPVARRATLQAELFSGAGLSPYLGGVGQGADFDRCRAVASRGGWVALALAPSPKELGWAVGASVDDPVDGDVALGARTSNRSLFGNVVYSLGRHAQVGVELSYWRTGYRAAADADAVRAQTSFIYRF